MADDQDFLPSKGKQKDHIILAGGPNKIWQKAKIIEVFTNGFSVWEGEDGSKKKYQDSYSIEPEPEGEFWFKEDTEVSVLWLAPSALWMEMIRKLSEKHTQIHQIPEDADDQLLKGIFQDELRFGFLDCAKLLKEWRTRFAKAPVPAPDPNLSSLQEQFAKLQIEMNRQLRENEAHTLSVLKQIAQGNMDLSINQTFSETYHEQEKKGGREALIRPAEYQNVAGLKKWENVWENIEGRKPKTPSEKVLQELLPPALEEIFPDLEFVDTHRRSDITHPLKPDVTVVKKKHYANVHTAVAFLELKDAPTATPSACGQVISVVNRAFAKQTVERAILGFVITGSKDSNFVYHRINENKFQMDKVSWSDILSFLHELSKSSSVSLPKVEGYDAKCLLGVGSTSFVYCVTNKEKELVLKFPKNPQCRDVLYAEANIMKKMSQNAILSQHRHLAHYHGPVKAQEGKGKHYQESILLSPVADFSNPPLTREDVVKLAGALSDLHSAGFLHRDISPGNIGHYLAGDSFFEPFLRDFGCSIELQPVKLTPPQYAGTIATASTRVLKELAQGSERPCIEPMDDLESLLKSVILKATRSQVSANPGSPLLAKVRASLEFWEGRGFIGEESLKSIFHSTRYSGIGDFVLCLPPRKTAYEK